MQFGGSFGYWGTFWLKGLLSKLRGMEKPRSYSSELHRVNNRAINALNLHESDWDPDYDESAEMY